MRLDEIFGKDTLSALIIVAARHVGSPVAMAAFVAAMLGVEPDCAATAVTEKYRTMWPEVCSNPFDCEALFAPAIVHDLHVIKAEAQGADAWVFEAAI